MTLAEDAKEKDRKVFFAVLASWRDEKKIGEKITLAKNAKGAKLGEVGKMFSLRSPRFCSGQAWREKLC